MSGRKSLSPVFKLVAEQIEILPKFLKNVKKHFQLFMCAMFLIQSNAPKMLGATFYVIGGILVYLVEAIDVVIIEKRKVPGGVVGESVAILL